MTMSDVFGDARPGEQIVAREPRPGLAVVRRRKLINLASGVTWERLTPTSDPGTSSCTSSTRRSESCPEDSLVTHGGREYGYVMSGPLGVRVGFDEHELGSGDSVSFDSSSPHRLWAIGDEPVTAIWFVVGRAADPRT